MDSKISKFLETLEDGLLLLLVLSVVLLSVSQLVLRNLDMGGMGWSDSALRINVLWLAMFGAMRASRLQQHISIDVLTRFVTPQRRKWLHFWVSICCAVICALAAWYSLQFILLEKEDGMLAFLNVPVWLCEAVIPLAFTVIAWRFGRFALSPPVDHADQS